MNAQTTQQGPAGGGLVRRLRMMSRNVRKLKANSIYCYERVFDRQGPADCDIDSVRKVILGSYNYLGLTHHPDVIEAARNALDGYGVGTHGTRITLGTTGLHRSLERTISGWLGTDDSLVVSSGLIANVATIQALTERGDRIFYDTVNHASLHDGCELSRAELVEFSHLDLHSLERELRLPCDGMKWVVVDSVFSMDGDIVNLPAIRQMCDEHQAALIVDEAHSIGVLGESGAGITSHFGMAPGDIDVRIGVLSKGIPGVGGFVTGSRDLIESLKATSHAFIFSGALPPSVVAGAEAAIKVMQSDPSLQERLHRNRKQFAQRLSEAGFDLGRGGGATPILPIMCRSSRLACQMAQSCFDRGVLVVPAIYPAVAIDAARLRTTVTAALTRDDIDFAVKVLVESADECGLFRGENNG